VVLMALHRYKSLAAYEEHQAQEHTKAAMKAAAEADALLKFPEIRIIEKERIGGFGLRG
jgi:quinol monooxygenase YgiN